MKTLLKRICLIFMSLVFCVSPIFFAGCAGGGDLDIGDDDSGSQTTGGGDIDDEEEEGEEEEGFKMDFDINEYVSAIKVAYTSPYINGASNESLNTYADECVLDAKLIAADILSNLCSYYGIENGEDRDYPFENTDEFQYKFNLEERIPFNGGSVSVSIKNTNEPAEPLEIDVNANTINLSSQITKYFKYTNTIYNENYKSEKWSLLNNLSNGILADLNDAETITYPAYVNIILNDAEGLNKLTYAILYISAYFTDATEANYNNLWTQFKTTYETLTDFDGEISKIKTNAKHNGISKEDGSFEQKALYDFIKYEIIGETAFNFGNKYYEYNGTNYVMVDDTGKIEGFEGDSYLYISEDEINKIINNDDISNSRKNTEKQFYYLSEFINNYYKFVNDGKYAPIKILSALNNNGNYNGEQLFTMGESQNVQLWHDFDGDGLMNIVEYAEGSGIPKYRPDDYFKNYPQIVKYVIDNALNNTEIKDKDGNVVQTGHKPVSNIYSRDYEYASLELPWDNKTGKGTPYCAYKNIVVCAKDREDGNNNFDFMDIVFETQQGQSVKLDLYVRYYVTNKGYAYWKNDGGEYSSVFNLGSFNVTSESITVNSETGMLESADQDFDLQDKIFKTAMFFNKTTEQYYENDNKFSKEMTDVETSETSTIDIWRIEPMPVGLYDVMVDEGQHTSVFGDGSKYVTITDDSGKSLYGYDFENMKEYEGQEENYGYFEIIISASDETPFSFGMMAFIPKTEQE